MTAATARPPLPTRKAADNAGTGEAMTCPILSNRNR
jgi:hypothetical protein